MDTLTTTEAAEILEQTPSNITALIRKGTIPAIKRGRVYLIKRADWEAFLFQRENGPPLELIVPTGAEYWKREAKRYKKMYLQLVNKLTEEIE